MDVQTITCGNRLLSGLPPAEIGRLAPQLDYVDMPLGKVLQESGERLEYVYFPVTSIVSVQSRMEDGTWAEVAGVGKEGMLGISMFIGGRIGGSVAFVRTAGYGYRLKAQHLVEEFRCGRPLRDLLLRYGHALNALINQMALCNSKHSLEQQMCRWLLCALEQPSSTELILTQEVLANMLGALHEDVNQVVATLHQYGIVRSHNGHLTILDRNALKDRACECYGVAKAELERLQGYGWRGAHIAGNPVRWSGATVPVPADCRGI